MSRLLLVTCAVILNRPSLSSQDLSVLYERAHKAIVSIEVNVTGASESRYGSGFLISSRGIIVTNYHMIRDLRSILVKDAQGNTWDSVLIGPINEQKDLAMLKVAALTPSFLAVPTNPRLKIGLPVVAIGNPKGLESTLSEGIISGLRNVSEQMGEVIQTTAPISPGSSGGPLLNLKGEAIAVTTFQLIGGQNLNFAVPLGSFVTHHPEPKWLSIPEWKKELVRPEVERLLASANVHLSQGLVPAAKRYYTNVLALDETNLQALLALSRINVEEWDNLAARSFLTKYLRLDSTNAEAFELNGIALDKLGHTNEALLSFRQALVLDDSRARSHYEIIVSMSLFGDFSQIQSHLDRLKALDDELYARARDLMRRRNR